MANNIQMDSVACVRTTVISEINPCTCLKSVDGDDIDNSTYYGLTPSSNATYGSGKTTVSFSVSWEANTLQRRVLIALSGPYMGKSYTIIGNTTGSLDLAEDCHSEILTTRKYTVVHTAASMFDYCLANDENNIAITEKSIAFQNGSPEKPSSYADHTTIRPGTGKYSQSIKLNGCELWDQDPRNRIWKLNALNGLIYQWHKLDNNNPVFMIITIEFLDRSTGETYSANMGFNYKNATDTSLNERGYLRGYPMGTAGTYVFSPEFSIAFEEEWPI